MVCYSFYWAFYCAFVKRFVCKHIYIKYNYIYVNFEFKEAFKATVIFCVPIFLLQFCRYKYGGQKKANKYASRVLDKNKK